MKGIGNHFKQFHYRSGLRALRASVVNRALPRESRVHSLRLPCR